MVALLPDKGLITRPMLAQAWGVTEQTIEIYEHKYGLPVLSVGNTRCYDMEEVVKWLKRRRARKAA